MPAGPAGRNIVYIAGDAALLVTVVAGLTVFPLVIFFRIRGRNIGAVRRLRNLLVDAPPENRDRYRTTIEDYECARLRFWRIDILFGLGFRAIVLLVLALSFYSHRHHAAVLPIMMAEIAPLNSFQNLSLRSTVFQENLKNMKKILRVAANA